METLDAQASHVLDCSGWDLRLRIALPDAFNKGILKMGWSNSNAWGDSQEGWYKGPPAGGGLPAITIDGNTFLNDSLGGTTTTVVAPAITTANANTLLVAFVSGSNFGTSPHFSQR
jgi:hypothetical protein